MPAADYLVGALCFGTMLACALGAAWLVLSRQLAHLEGAARLSAFGLLAILAILAVHLLPLAFGLLSQVTVLAASLLVLGAASTVPRVPESAGGGSEDSELEAEPGPARVLAAIAVGALALLALAIMRDQLFLAPQAVDTLNFHLPGVARWLETGSLWQVDALLPFVAPGNYPNNGDVLLLAAVLPWSSDFLSHLAFWPVYMLTGVAIYALARELAAPRSVAVSAACLFLAPPAVLLPALIFSYPDALALLGLAAGLLFLVRRHRTGLTSDLVLSGLALGVAFGTKWYGVSVVAIVVVVWIGAGLFARRRPTDLVRETVALVGLIAAGGGIWLIRNWIESGNPVFPVRVAPLGIEIFDAPLDVIRERGGFTIAGYLDDPGVWGGYILPQLRDTLALAGAIGLTGLALAAATLASRARRGAKAGIAAAGVVLAVVLVAAYAVTPYSAGGPEGAPTLVGADARYAVPALLVAVVVGAWAAGRYRHGPTVFAAVAVLAVVDCAVLVSDNGVSLATIGANDWLAAIAFAVIAAGAVWLAVRAWPTLSGRRGWLLAGAVALLVLLAGGYEMQKRFNGIRYMAQDEAIDHLLSEASSGQSIGLAGIWGDGIPPVLPAFGPRYENEVAYVGPEVDGFLRRYRSQEDFAAALRDGEFDYLFVGHGIHAGESLREAGWARAAGFEEVASSDRLILLRAPG